MGFWVGAFCKCPPLTEQHTNPRKCTPAISIDAFLYRKYIKKCKEIPYFWAVSENNRNEMPPRFLSKCIGTLVKTPAVRGFLVNITLDKFIKTPSLVNQCIDSRPGEFLCFVPLCLLGSVLVTQAIRLIKTINTRSLAQDFVPGIFHSLILKHPFLTGANPHVHPRQARHQTRRTRQPGWAFSA
jgi:hypothetical protein